MDYITQIQEIARLAGAEAMKYFNHIKASDISCKSTPKDIVSVADKAVDTMSFGVPLQAIAFSLMWLKYFIASAPASRAIS